MARQDMLRAAIYSRFSTDQQNETTLDDQIRRCRQIAQEQGFLVDETLIFCDAAISGHSKDIRKREGLSKLFDAWDQGFVDVVLTTEMSRLGRDATAGLAVLARLQDGRVHLVTDDGIDTRRPSWVMLALVRLGLATEEARTISARVSRSMLGVLERGGLISQPPYGYELNAGFQRDAHRAEGSRWVINPTYAAIVHEIFEMRASGMSVYGIARALNDRGIPSSRRKKDGLPSPWRGGTVYRLLSNRTYKGEFAYGASPFSISRSRRTGEPLQPKLFERPELRIIDDELWGRCNPTARVRKLRGGAKHVLAGLISCSMCKANLALKDNGSKGSLSCSQCEQRSRCEEGAPKAPYTSPRAATAALRAVLLEVVSATGALQEVKTRLRERLREGPGAELQTAQATVKRLAASEATLLELALQPGVGLDVVGAKLGENRAMLATAKARVQTLEQEVGRLTAAAVEKQCQVNVDELVDKLLKGEPSVHQVRAMLSRLIERFIFLARLARGKAEFEITLVPGVLAALASGSRELDQLPVTYRVTTTIDRSSQTNVFTQVTRVK